MNTCPVDKVDRIYFFDDLKDGTDVDNADRVVAETPALRTHLEAEPLLSGTRPCFHVFADGRVEAYGWTNN